MANAPSILWILLAILLAGILISVYFNYSLLEKNKELKISYGNLKENFNTSQNNFLELTTSYQTLESKHTKLSYDMELITESLGLMDCTEPGGRRGVLICGFRAIGWTACYDSPEDTNPGDKNQQCCENIKGTWHEGKCCGSYNDNAGWVGKLGSCTNEGTWVMGR